MCYLNARPGISLAGQQLASQTSHRSQHATLSEVHYSHSVQQCIIYCILVHMHVTVHSPPCPVCTWHMHIICMCIWECCQGVTS